MRIDAIELSPHTLMTPVLQEIFAETESGNAWTSRTPQRISRTGIDGSTPISTQIHSGIIKTSTPYSSDSTRNRITIVTIGTRTDPPAGDFWSPGIRNKRQSAFLNIRKFDKLGADIDGKFTNNTFAPPIFTELFSEKLSNSSRQGYLCAHRDAPCNISH